MRLGLIGAGAVAELHAEAAAALPGVRVAAVCDLDIDLAARVAGPHRARVFADYRELLESGTADAVVISTPHALHTTMVTAATEAGLHVLVEKPMATTVDDCLTMIEASDLAGVSLAVGHIQHFLPDKVAARSALREGALGEVLLVHDYRSTDYRPGTRPAWFFRPEIAGGGALMNIGAHMIDRCSWLTGTLPQTVDAALEHRFGVGVETDGTLRLTMTDGLVASLTLMSTTPHTVDEVLVAGTRGTLVADPRRGTYMRTDGQTRALYEHRPTAIADAFTAQLDEFVRHVQDGAELSVSLELSVTVIATVLAAYRSAEAGQTVGIEIPALL